MKRNRWSSVLATFKNWSVFDWLMFGMVLAGAGLGVFQYFVDRDIWLDESSLMLNILESSYGDLLKPMNRNQVAPIGYLWLTKFLTQAFGTSTYAFRAPSLLSYLLSIFLTYRIGAKVSGLRYIGLSSAALLAGTYTFIYCGNEVKQYAVDIVMALAVIYITLGYKHSKRSMINLFLIGVVSIFFSNISPIVLTVCGLRLVGNQIIELKRWRLTIPMMGWLVVFAAYFLMFIHDHPTQAMMKTFWEKHFFTGSPLTSDYWFSVFKRIDVSFFGILQLSHWSNWVFYGLVTIGIAVLIAKRRLSYIWLLVGCVFVHVVLSSIELYPYYIRLVMYQVAPVIILSQLSFSPLLESKHRLVRVVICLIMLLQPIYVFNNTLELDYPIHRAEITEALDEVVGRENDDIPLYLYYIGLKPFDYYTKYRRVEVKNPILRSKSYRLEPEKYLDQINTFRGLTWMYFTGVYPFNQPENEMTMMLDHITSHGGEVLETHEFRATSNLYLVKFYPPDSLLNR